MARLEIGLKEDRMDAIRWEVVGNRTLTRNAVAQARDPQILMRRVN